MAYNKTNWENYPSTATPVNSSNLNNLESGVADAHAQLDGRLSDGQLNATIAGQVVEQGTTKMVRTSGRLASWGHSYQFGIGCTDVGKRFARLLADHYRLDEVNEAVSGTAVASDASGASFGKFLQSVTRPGGGAVPGSGVTAVAGAGFTTPRGVYDFFYGINDLAGLGNTAAAAAPIREVLRTMLSRARAGVIYENTSSLTAFSGTDWTAQPTGFAHSGGSYHYTVVNGADVQVALPADFPGGTIAVGVVVPSGAGNGARWTTNSIPGRTETFDAYNTRSGSQTGAVWRLEDVPAGARTILITVSNITGFAGFDYLQWEAPNEEAPLVILHKQPYPVDYSAYAPATPPTDAGVDVLNGIIDALAVEFGDRVLAVDHSSMNREASMFAADKLHPSDLGNRRIFDETLAALTAAGFIIESGRAVTRRYDCGTAAPTGTRTYYNVGDYVENTSPTITDGTYVAGWRCTVAGRPATWVEDRRMASVPVAEASGSATIGSTFAVTSILHGLGVTPSVVVLTARTAGVALGVTNRNGESFTVTRTDTATGVTFDWYARA